MIPDRKKLALSLALIFVLNIAIILSMHFCLKPGAAAGRSGSAGAAARESQIDFFHT